jgi:uncharacterized protein (DUF488 family)
MAISEQLEVYTIGFTQKSAEKFFGLLLQANVSTLLDVRLHTTSQLSGFAKQADLIYFLRQICGVQYVHLLDWAPTKEMLDAYKKKEISWEAYEDKFLNLMARRNIERDVNPEIIQKGCLLCSEHKPHHCHRRLVVEYINESTDLHLNVKHLV